jgi:hypothetical protein
VAGVRNQLTDSAHWAAGAMDSASDFGSEGSRFESWVARDSTDIFVSFLRNREFFFAFYWDK